MTGNCSWTAGPVPKGTVFVMGDNRAHSADSTVHLCPESETDCTKNPYVDDRPDRRQGVRAGLAAGSRSAACTGPDAFDDVPDAGSLSLVSALPRGVTVRRDAGLYGYERALRRHGIEPIAGVDEAGRGACAGPLVAGAAILPPAGPASCRGWPTPSCSPRRPASACYDQVMRRAVAWSVVVVAHEECDRLGMHVANIEALRRAVALLDVPPAYVLTDGFPVDGLGVPGLAVWKGDRVAGLHRGGLGAGQGDPRPDHGRAGRRVAGYDFKTHKGYITEVHTRRADRARPLPGASACGSSTCGGPPGCRGRRANERAEPGLCRDRAESLRRRGELG